MMRVAGIALAAALSAVGAAKAVVIFESHAPKAKPAALELTAPAPAASGDAAQVVKGDDGHYWAQATVNGSAVRFLVDTGASAVALSQADAQRLGYQGSDLAYDYKVTTASGEARAARIKLASVSVSGAEVRDVDAYVIENGLQTSLLGMSYLGRLSRFEATPQALILHP
ncbi:MAG: family clan aspartic protease [Caulobacteraceae bacterium]|nr:family clan aspartic protease [Caulobacteraceae bacterium]